jgi:hypothetical protein
MKPQPVSAAGWIGGWVIHTRKESVSLPHFLDLCPVQVGDIFYVREPYYAYGRWITRFNAKKGRDEWHFEDMTLGCGFSEYLFPDSPKLATPRKRGSGCGWYKRPSLFLPKAAARTRKRVTGIRVEQVDGIWMWVYELGEVDL